MPDFLPVVEWLAKSAARAVGAFLDSLARPREVLATGDARRAAEAAAADAFAETEAEQEVSEPRFPPCPDADKCQYCPTNDGIDCTLSCAKAKSDWDADAQCNCTAFGELAFDSKYCTLHNTETSAVPPAAVDDPAGGAPASAPHPPAGSPPNFAGAAASLADGSSKSSSRDLLNPSVREDKRQDGVSQGPHPADPQPPTVPVAVSARTIPAAPATGLDQAVQVICEVLAEHEAYDYAGDVECCHERGGAARFPDWQAWREHVAQPIAERLTGAIQLEIDQFASDALRLVAMTFPQSQKHSK